jgi:hypothetical protein
MCAHVCVWFFFNFVMLLKWWSSISSVVSWQVWYMFAEWFINFEYFISKKFFSFLQNKISRFFFWKFQH